MAQIATGRLLHEQQHLAQIGEKTQIEREHQVNQHRECKRAPGDQQVERGVQVGLALTELAHHFGIDGLVIGANGIDGLGTGSKIRLGVPTGSTRLEPLFSEGDKRVHRGLSSVTTRVLETDTGQNFLRILHIPHPR